MRPRAAGSPPRDRSPGVNGVAAPSAPSEHAELRTIADLLPVAVERYGDAPALRSKRAGAWEDMSFDALGRAVEEIALGLIARGLERGERVALFAESRAEWTLCDLAILAAGGVTVPVYPTSTVEEAEWLLGNSEAAMAVCETDEHVATIRAASVRQVREVIVFEGASTASLGDLREQGRAGDPDELRRRAGEIAERDPLTIIYTSGTTGPPKGCVWTHANLIALMEMFGTVLQPSEGDVFYLHLPLAHANSRLGQFLNIHRGVTIAYCSRPYRDVLDDLAEVRPTILASVPRTWEKAYGAATAGHTAADVGEAVRTALAVSRLEEAGEEVAPDLRARRERWEHELFEPARTVLGGRVRTANTGAAPIAIDVLEFFRAAGVPIFEGYGLTETTCVASSSTPEEHRVGSVGRILPGMDVQIAEDGEILLSGPNIFPGYHRDPEATAATIRDGWLHTGDLGEVDGDGFLYITGRKKELSISSAGKNIAPANVENELTRSPLLTHAVVYGDRRPYCVALLTLDEAAARAWLESHGHVPAARLQDDAHLRAAIEELVADVNEKFAPPFRVRRFAILDRGLDADAGELTPTHKIRRAAVYDNHRALYESLYEGAE